MSSVKFEFVSRSKMNTSLLKNKFLGSQSDNVKSVFLSLTKEYMTVKDIKEKSGVHVNAVRPSLKVLIEKGFVYKRRNKNVFKLTPYGVRTLNNYKR